MARETRVQSLVESYQRLKKWYLMLPCLTQHYKVQIKSKEEQSREGVAPSPTSWCSSYRKGSLRVTLDYGHQLYYIFKHFKMNRSTKRFIFFQNYLFRSYMRACFQLVAFVRDLFAKMWHKAIWVGHLMRFELTTVDLQVEYFFLGFVLVYKYKHMQNLKEHSTSKPHSYGLVPHLCKKPCIIKCSQTKATSWKHTRI